MKAIRPPFHRTNKPDELEREAERVRNRDWVEILQVVHPSQAESAEREYLLARLKNDWPKLASPLVANHSIPSSLTGKNLLVLCDHNTFANELSLIAGAVEKKITTLYGYTLKIHARASRRMDWQQAQNPLPAEDATASLKKTDTKGPVVNALLDKLIVELGKL